jgi:signal transduction histidine kinase
MLQPVSLLEQGLVAAIGHLADHVKKSSGIRCDFKGEDLPHIAAADANHLYRIAQEALNNAVQHSAASQIDVGLSRSGRGFILTIADDGSGMVEPSGEGSGLGLQIMRYRSDLLGAALTIQSKPGRGTVVTCCYHVVGGQRPVSRGQ